jgi:hypothetical protein
MLSSLSCGAAAAKASSGVGVGALYNTTLCHYCMFHCMHSSCDQAFWPPAHSLVAGNQKKQRTRTYT